MSIFRAKKLEKELSGLKNTAARLDMSAAENLELKTRIMAAIRLVPQDSASVAKQERFSKKSRMWLPKLAFSVLAGVVFLGGTVFASGYSLPGDVLYPVKKAKEKLELQLTPAGQPKALIMAKQAEERLHEFSDIKSIPTQPGNAEKLSKQKEEARAQASIGVSTAVESLTQVKKDLEDKGNAQAAENVNTAIARLVARAKTEDIDIEDRVGVSNEKQEKEEDKQKDDRKDKEGQEKGKRPEGEVRGLRHKAGDPDPRQQSRSQEATVPKILTPSLTASSGVSNLPNVLPQGQVLGASTSTGEGSVLQPQAPSATTTQSQEKEGGTETRKHESEPESKLAP